MNREHYMNTALSLAEATIGQTSPNPSVGAVVVKDGRIIGLGSHLKQGSEHAEVFALNQAGSEAEGADIYVTLEPCSHYGSTPPCADLIIEKKLKRVFIACLDPNPAVAGRGAERLRQAGIEVEIGIGEERAREINRKFFHYIETNRPFVTLKAAMTLDGKMAAVTGDSRWVTAEAAREDVHKQRDIHDAIMVGINTVLHDDPELTVRLSDKGKNPIRIILDTNLQMPETAKVLQPDAPVWIFCTRESAEKKDFSKQAHIRLFQSDKDKIDLEEVLDILGEHKIQSLYVEGGSTVHSEFINSQLFQECHWYIAPKLLGGKDSLSPVGGPSPSLMGEATLLEYIKVEQLGRDLKIIARPAKEEN